MAPLGDVYNELTGGEPGIGELMKVLLATVLAASFVAASTPVAAKDFKNVLRFIVFPPFFIGNGCLLARLFFYTHPQIVEQGRNRTALSIGQIKPVILHLLNHQIPVITCLTRLFRIGN